WDKEWVRELGLDPSELTPRDRGQFWYLAINRAQIDSSEAHQAGNRLAEVLKRLGDIVGPSPKHNCIARGIVRHRWNAPWLFVKPCQSMSPLPALGEGKLEAKAESFPRSPPEKPFGRWGQDTMTLLTVALCLVSAATAWYLLKEFATFLRPLLLAVFLCFLILPVHLCLKQNVSGIISLILIVGGSVALLFLLSLFI